MSQNVSNQLIKPASVDEAVAILASEGPSSQLVAGATWIMRAAIRGEKTDRLFVSLGRIDALKQVEISENQVSIGALVTHDTLSKLDLAGNDLNCLKQAALKSANPAIRNTATIGGNICSSQFFAADLVPALLCLGAHLEIQNKKGTSQIDIRDYLSSREVRPREEIVTKILINRSDRLSGHARLMMRQAGDYPVVIVSCSMAISADGKIETPRIVVGAIEPVAKRWLGLEKAITDLAFSDLDIQNLASSLITEFNVRNGSDASGKYRLKVLPKVAAQAFKSIIDTQAEVI